MYDDAKLHVMGVETCHVLLAQKPHTEYYGIGKDDILGIGAQVAAVKHPECIEVRRAALEHFMRACHHITTVLLSTLGVKLGLEAHVLPELHQIDVAGGNLARLVHNPLF